MDLCYNRSMSNCKLSPSDVEEIKSLRRQGWTYPQIGARYNINKNHAGRICRDQLWNKKPKTMEDRFWAKVDKKGPDECWRWKGSHSKKYGRPQFAIDGRHMRWASRAALTIKLGRDIRPNYEACHTCDNVWCVNLNHVYEGLPTSNRFDQYGVEPRIR